MSSQSDSKSPPGALKPSTDVVVIQGPTDDKKGLRVVRARDESVEIGEVRPLEEGKPLQGDIVRLEPRPGMPLVCDVKTELRLPSGSRPASEPNSSVRAHAGPAKVTTDAYRTNWDTIWRRSDAPDKPN